MIRIDGKGGVSRQENRRRVAILGGGFAGLHAARRLQRTLAHQRDREVVLISRENYVLFTPMLHEVAAGDLDPADIVIPLRKTVRRVRLIQAEVADIDPQARVVRYAVGALRRPCELTYDCLLLAMGSETNYFGMKHLEAAVATMKTPGTSEKRDPDQRGKERRTMETAYLSAVAALAGSALGGFTSLGASWLTQRVQVTAQRLEHELSRQEEVYKGFIHEASIAFADALEHSEADVAKLVRLYALVSRMRVLSSECVVEQADAVMRTIMETYRAPNRSLREVAEAAEPSVLDPLRTFSDACRAERRQVVTGTRLQ